MTQMFFFMIIDKEGSKRDSSLDQQDILYAHPSSNSDFIKNRGALITLWDISQNQDLVPEVRKLRALVNTGTVRMCVGVSDVEVAVLDDYERNLLFLFGTAVDNNWNSTCRSGAGNCLLTNIHSILTFTTSSIRRSLQEVVIRSDLDGMIISALYRMSSATGEKQNPHDALWSQVIPCYKQDANVNDLAREMIIFEAAEFLDEIFRMFPRSECYILGSCLYYNRVLLVNRLHPPLHDAVHKYLLLHKDGFRSEKNSDKNHVLRCYPKSLGSEVQPDASYYVLWTKFENLLHCCIVEVLETSDNINAMIFGSILSSMRTFMRRPDVQHLAGFFEKNSTNQLAHPSSIATNIGQGRTTVGSLVRTTSAPNVAQKFSLAGEFERTQGSRPPSLSQASGMFSMSSENLTRHPQVDPGAKRRSGVIFCVTVSGQSQHMVLESSMDDYSRNSFLPPKLFDDFMHHIPLLRNVLSCAASQSEEVTLLLEYPSPSLFKRYWISGRTLSDPSREMYLCYQEGSETAVALDYLMKM